jgi:acylglycerol lipase
MEHLEGTFKGVRETGIYYQGWLPTGPVKAVLLIVHGLAEHSGRYLNLVNYFVPLGYAVYGIDHPGHGQSDGTRVYVDRFEDFTRTVIEFVDMIRDWQPDQSIFLVGHSMGGLIGACYLLDHQDGLTGAILSGPAVKIPDKISPAIILLGKIFSALVPKFGLIGLEAEGISRDPEVVQAYLRDPLVYTGKITARLGAEMLQAMKRVSAEAIKIHLPILIIQGGADKLVDPAGARMLFDRVGSIDKKVIIYEGLYHEVFNEPEHGKVLDDVKKWLDGQLDAGK